LPSFARHPIAAFIVENRLQTVDWGISVLAAFSRSATKLHQRITMKHLSGGVHSYGCAPAARRQVLSQRSGRRSFIGSLPGGEVDATIMEALANEQFHSVRSLAQELDIRKSRTHDHLTRPLGLKNSHLRIVPFKLSPELQEPRGIIGRKQLRLLQ
jgi:hypothetical protein